MFTKTTFVLLGLFAACEVCTLVVFCYQRTVRKLALRLKLAQSDIYICYPPWMLTMYWATFSKYAIAVALLIIDWRCALVAVGLFALFFLVSVCISVPDGANLIRIYKEVKKKGNGALRAGDYQMLISEIEKGIVATGGDLAKLNEMEHENLEWTTKARTTHGHMWHTNGNKSSRTDRGYSSVSQRDESPTINDMSAKRHKEILESKDIRKYLELFKEAPTSVKISVVIWSLWVIVGLVLGIFLDENTQSNVGTAFVNTLFIAAILRGSRWVRNFYAIGVLLFTVLVGVNAISSSSFIDGATSIGIIINILIAVVYVCPLFAKSAHGWFYGTKKDSSNNNWIIVSLGFAIIILLLLIVTVLMKGYEDKTIKRNKADFYRETCQVVDTKSTCNQQRQILPSHGERNASRPAKNMPPEATRFHGKTSNFSRMSDEELDAEFERIYGSDSPTRYLPRKQTREERIAAIRQAAEQGNLDAMASLDRMASEQEDALAQIALGEMYQNGKGVARNINKALMWYRKAAEQGHTAAQCMLGAIYDEGRLVEKDEVEAIKWYRKSATQGNAYADSCKGVRFEIEISESDILPGFSLRTMKYSRERPVLNLAKG